MTVTTGGGVRLDEFRAGIDAALAGISHDIEGDDPVSQAARYALDGGGKRLRPVLCLAAMEAAGRVVRPTGPEYRAAAAIELVHTYSLVHDDLPCMDDDDLRRGRATVHRVYDSHTAMLAGFALVPMAMRVLDQAARDLDLDEHARRKAVRALAVGAGAAGMVGGQMLDLEAEGRSLGPAAMRRVHAMKTGALFSSALHIGGLLAGAQDQALAALIDFGRRLGLAFQIMDDVLDDTMAAATLGKTPGKDRDAAKVTFVSLLGVEGARSAAEAEARAAVDGLAAAGVASVSLETLARLAVDRDR